MISGKDVNFNDETHVLTINGEKHAVGDPGEIDAIDTRVTALEEGKLNNVLVTTSETALSVDDTFQIPAAMLERTNIILCFNRAAWSGSVTVTTKQIKQGDCAAGMKVVTGDINNPTVDKYIIFNISPTGLITIKQINSWSAPFVNLTAI